MNFDDIDKLLAQPIPVQNLDSLPNTIIAVESATPVSSEIDRVHRKVVTELNAFYLFNGKYQKLGELRKQVPELDEFTPVGLKDLFTRANSSLKNRGLPEYHIKYKTATLDFEPEFIGAVTILADFTDKRPMAAKLKEIGVSTKQWNGWLKSQKYYDYWHNTVDRLMDREVYEEGRMALAQNVSRGDLASFKYFNEMTEKFTASKEFDPRIIGVLMSGVLDIIMRHVEGSVASKIAEEIQAMGISSLSGIQAISATSTVVDLD